MSRPLSLRAISSELEKAGVELREPGLEKLGRYLELLLQWNRRINLVGLRDPRRIVRELFGESLYLSRVVELRGCLLDVGSGAGFPGLALKLAVEELAVTLVEANRRKCAFLKEVARELRFEEVRAVGERFEIWAREQGKADRFNFVTTRAVGAGEELLRGIGELLKVDGQLALFTTPEGSQKVRSELPDWRWREFVKVPGSREHGILIGTWNN
jgi:16S rRNA (guanine527-N7)-methyltransferase